MSATQTHPRTTADAPRTDTSRPRRLDIQGLRAVAVVSVLLFHAKIPGFSGGFVGVDVFFVISGYLISTVLVRELRATGGISLLGFYARRIRRIVPAAALVIVATVVLSVLLLPVSRWSDVASDAIASSLYWVNWSLATRSVDYLAQNAAASPLQHFWSLAIEEQYYLLWPAILLAMGWFLRIGGSLLRRVRRRGFASLEAACLVTALAVLVPSLTWSAYRTAVAPGSAYFQSTTRVWELALGACLAFLPSQAQHLPRPVALLMGWTGFAAVTFSVFSYSSSQPYPGLLALLPTLGAAGIIVAGPVAGPVGPVAVLSLNPLTRVGDMSYSLYLWHWPLLVVATALLDRLTLVSGLAVVGLAFLPAWLSWKFVERPAQAGRWLAASTFRTFQVGLLATLLGVLSGLLLHASLFPVQPPPPYSPALIGPRQPDADSPPRELWGAEVLDEHPNAGEPVDDVSFFTPNVQTAYQDNPSVYAEGCHLGTVEDQPKGCEYRYGKGSRRIAIAGDSHAAQWVPALKIAARDRGWIVDSYTKSSCPVIDGDVQSQDGTRYSSCTRWNRNLRESLAMQRPDVLVVSSYGYQMATAPSAGLSDHERFVRGMRSAYRDIASLGIPVVVIHDTPNMRIDIPECVAEHRGELTKCAVDRASALQNNGIAQREAVAGLEGVSLVDLTQQICPASSCAPVIGRVLVYRDSHHLTATYSSTLSGSLVSTLEGIPRLRLR